MTEEQNNFVLLFCLPVQKPWQHASSVWAPWARCGSVYTSPSKHNCTSVSDYTLTHTHSLTHTHTHTHTHSDALICYKNAVSAKRRSKLKCKCTNTVTNTRRTTGQYQLHVLPTPSILPLPSSSPPLLHLSPPLSPLPLPPSLLHLSLLSSSPSPPLSSFSSPPPPCPLYSGKSLEYIFTRIMSLEQYVTLLGPAVANQHRYITQTHNGTYRHTHT